MEAKEKESLEELQQAESLTKEEGQSVSVEQDKVKEDLAKGEKHKKDKKIKVSNEEFEALKKDSKELSEMKEKLLRAVAEFENSKKRLIREKEEFAQFANKRMISALLPIIDNFDRAIQSAEANHSVDSLKEGVDMIYKQFLNILSSEGLEKIKAVGEPFDPNKHEAIGTVETNEYEEDVVVEEVSPGYLYKEILLKPAMVRISVATT